MPVKIEICSDSLMSAMTAEKGGADRIELCTGLAEGGVTPSQGTIASVVENVKIPVNVLIRPRPGNFCYTPEEISSMIRDIEFCKSAGVAGIVCGALDREGNVDMQVSKELLDAAGSMDSTYHRAFDVVNDPLQALESIIKLGYKRILTSGQMISAFEGRFSIAAWVKTAGEQIIIMPGAGINERNLTELFKSTHATEFHMSLRQPVSKDHCLESLNTNTTLLTVSQKRLEEVIHIAKSLK
jgi:copper homeostasis protein